MTHHSKPLATLEPGLHRPSATKRPRTSTVLAVAAIAPMIALQGCAKFSQNHFTVGSVNQTHEERHPIVLNEKERTLDMPIASSAYELSRSNASAIEGFARAYKRSANGVFTIMLPEASPNAVAARSIAPQIAETIENAGVPGHRISTVTYHAAEHGSTAPVRLSFGAIQASVGECGKWDDDLSNHSENKQYTNFGCATQQNFAAMLSNPADLVAPRGQSPVDAARRSGVIDKYRKGEETVTITNDFNTPPESVWE